MCAERVEKGRGRKLSVRISSARMLLGRPVAGPARSVRRLSRHAVRCVQRPLQQQRDGKIGNKKLDSCLTLASDLCRIVDIEGAVWAEHGQFSKNSKNF